MIKNKKIEENKISPRKNEFKLNFTPQNIIIIILLLSYLLVFYAYKHDIY